MPSNSNVPQSARQRELRLGAVAGEDPVAREIVGGAGGERRRD